jgi:hypothetical protein
MSEGGKDFTHALESAGKLVCKVDDLRFGVSWSACDCPPAPS